MQFVTKPRLHYAMLANVRALVTVIQRPFFGYKMNIVVMRDSVNLL